VELGLTPPEIQAALETRKPSVSNWPYTFAMVLGFTVSSVASSRIDAILCSGGKAPETIPSLICLFSCS
jgi:hypothetical protein